MIIKNIDKVFTFSKGGIHPPYKKELAAGKPIEVCPLPDKVIIPLQQHIGAPCKALVEKGQKVKAGQKIGESDAFVHSPVHSSVNGTVKSIAPKLHTSGFMVDSVVIDVDKEDTSLSLLKPLEKSADTKEIIQRVKDAGLAGMGGAAFPTHVKLSPPKDKKIEAVMINGCECEPYITCDHRSMLEEADRLIEGLMLIMKAVNAKEGYIAIEINKGDAISLLEEKTSSLDDIHVIKLKTKYPQGSEKQLIEAATGRQVPSGGLPADVGVLVQNVGTAVAVQKAVIDGQPLIERVVSISGEGIKEPKNLLVKIGTPLSHLIEVADGLEGENNKIIAGGPMTGSIQTSLDAPVVKGTSAVTVLKQDELKVVNPDPCIKCANCVDACPISLLPLRIRAYSNKGMFDELEELHVADCIECGCCSYVCPARIQLVHWIRYAKQKLREKNNG